MRSTSGQDSGEVFLGRDIGHQRDYSEEVAGRIDAEVRGLIERAHDEAWEILVEYRDVLDALVLELLEKETLNAAQLAEIFAPIVKRPPRQVWLSSEQRAVSDRPPVQTPAEVAAQNGHVVVPEDEAVAANHEPSAGRDRRAAARRRRPRPSLMVDPIIGPHGVMRGVRPATCRGGDPRAPARRRRGP